MPVSTGYHWSVRARQARQAQEKEDLPFRGTIFTKVTSPSAGSERVTVSSFIGDKIVGFSYPFASTNAWIRGQPEAATTMIAIIGGDTKDLQPIGYFDSNKAIAAENYAALAEELRSAPAATVPNIQPYRVLAPGDIDMGSNFAQTFLGQRDVYQSRGGLSHFTMTSQAARLETPLYEVHGPAHATSANLNDEVRFGVVRRATPTSSASVPALVRGPYVSTRPEAFGAAAFAKEHTVVLNQHGVPGKLIDHRQGVVVEDDGLLARSRRTQRGLRARFRWFTPYDDSRVEVDEDGNWLAATGMTATDGGAVEIPAGNLTVNVGQRLAMRSRFDMELSSLLAGLNVTAATGFRVSTPARGELEGAFGMAVKSTGIIQVDTPTPMGISLGTAAGVKYPVLVANPTYISTLCAWYGSEATLNSLITAYGTAAAAAWAAIGPLTSLLDPSGAIPALCMTAGAAATAMSAGATAAGTTLALHQPTVTLMPSGFISNKTISE